MGFNRIKQGFLRGFLWWLGAELNRRHKDFQSSALPTELPSQTHKSVEANDRLRYRLLHTVVGVKLPTCCAPWTRCIADAQFDAGDRRP